MGAMPVETSPRPSERTTDVGPVVLVGNPNAGKTTLFNQLTGLRFKTANFPGTTLDVRAGRIELNGQTRELIDMPGLYSLTAVASEERIAMEAILGESAGRAKPSAIILLLDATNLTRNLFLASQIFELGVPTVVALNMVDLAKKSGVEIDVDALSEHLGCRVAPVVAKSGKGVANLVETCDRAVREKTPPVRAKLLSNIDDPSHAVRYDWAESVAESCVTTSKKTPGRKSEAVDAFLVHPVIGIAVFAAILFVMFYLIFSFATIPMDLIDGFVGTTRDAVAGLLPEGTFNSLVTNGIIDGVGSVVIFLPQICILFFCISLLEDTGYLARAACVMDRVLRKAGLPGKAFVPMLSAHACAIPAIMSARVIEDRNDRLTAILVLPLMTCSARLPVYAMVTTLLFPMSNFSRALVTMGAYSLGLFAALVMAFVFRRTLFKGPTAPLLLEMPTYKVPSVKTALLTAYDRGRRFVMKAGTVILAISIVLWALMTFPKPPQTASASVEEAPAAVTSSTALPEANPDAIAAQEALRYSAAGRLGTFIEPVLAPLGFDWRIGVGVIASFAAREVVVSALSVIYGAGDDGAEGGDALLARLSNAKRPDGSAAFGTATAFSFLVFFVLAMQCLPTQAVTRRETGSWKWAAFQLGYMTCLAYVASLITYQTLTAFGVS